MVKFDNFESANKKELLWPQIQVGLPHFSCHNDAELPNLLLCDQFVEDLGLTLHRFYELPLWILFDLDQEDIFE